MLARSSTNKRRRQASLRARRGRRGFTVAEVVIAMAIIVMMSVLGFYACYVGLNIERNANRNFAVRTVAENVRSAFAQALEDTNGVSSDEEDKKSFILAFNARLAFALDSYEPNVYNFSESAGYGLGDVWSVQIANETRVEYSATVDENGQQHVTQTTVVLEGLDLTYDGTTARYNFEYRYYTEQLELRASVNILQGVWSLTLRGYGAGSSYASYEWTGRYS